MSLFEKLQALQEENENETPETSENPSQCECGSQLEGECGDCDEASPSASVHERLDRIGGAKAVNPPEGSEPVQETTPSVQEKTEDGKEQCPHCKKSFKHLSRHKCKQMPTEAPEQTPEQAPEAHATTLQHLPCDPLPGEWPIQKLDGPGIASVQAHIESAILPKLEALFEKYSGQESTTSDAPPKPTKGYVLLLDCIMHDKMNMVVQSFDRIIPPLTESVAKENEVAYWSLLDYGKSPGHLAARFERWLLHVQPTGYISVDSSTPEARACMHVLKKHAANIIQGVR